MTNRVPNKLVLRFWALAGVAMAVVVLYLCLTGPSSFPTLGSLERVTGQVAWTEPDRYGINFGLAGDQRTFFYARKSGSLGRVASVLSSPAEQPISVLIPQAPQQGLPKPPYFQVHALTSQSGQIRSYEQIRKAWNSDYLYGYAVVLFALLAAAYLEYVARRAQPNNSFKPKPLRSTKGMAG